MTIQNSRRQVLKTALMGSGLLGLRSMVSGLPMLLLADPRRFLQKLTPSHIEQQSRAPQFLILATSDNGEPMNCNAPGMYNDPNFVHPADISMAATKFALGAQTVTAAKPWSALPASMLSRSAFFHYSTGAFQHGTLGGVHALQGHIRRANMLVSLMSSALQPVLSTIQDAPICMTQGGDENITFEGRVQPVYYADSLKGILGEIDLLQSIAAARSLRDRDVDAINALVRGSATSLQKDLIDSWINSQAQARSIPENLIATINNINDNSFASKLTAALSLVKAKITPIVNIHYSMGSDNHHDINLQEEVDETVSCLSDLGNFATELQSSGLADSVTFATLNNFGRTNVNTAGIPQLGRDHNGLHAVSIAMGKNFRPGVYGGAILQGTSAAARGIDSASGQASDSGDIVVDDTLVSYGATLAAGIGADTDAVMSMFNDVPVKVSAALT